MKKYWLIIFIFLSSASLVWAAPAKPANVSNECWSGYFGGSTANCTPAELQSVDAAVNTSAQSNPTTQQRINPYDCDPGMTYSSQANGCVPLPPQPSQTPSGVTTCNDALGNPTTCQAGTSVFDNRSITQPSNPTNQNTATPATTAVNPNAFCQNGLCTYTPLEPIPGLPSKYGAGGSTFQELISSAFKILLSVGATLAVVMLVIGALTYMFSDVVGNKTKALSRIRNAMWAIVLLVSSYLILNTINPDLVTFKLNLVALTAPYSPGTTGVTTQTQLTTAQIQAALNQCTAIGKTLGGANPDGSFTCR